MLSQPYLTLALTFPHWPSLLTNATLCSIASVPAIDSMFLFIRADSIAASAALLSAHVIYYHSVPTGQQPPGTCERSRLGITFRARGRNNPHRTYRFSGKHYKA